MRRLSIAFVSAALLLGGCVSTPRVAIAPSLPVAPAALAAACAVPDVQAGQPAVTEIARQRQALANCARKKSNLTAFYADLRRRLHK